MADQCDAMGGCGMLNESVVEAAHVAMNEFARRYACVTDREHNIRLRHQAYSHASNLKYKNIRAIDNQRAAKKRARANHVSRRAKHDF